MAALTKAALKVLRLVAVMVLVMTKPSLATEINTEPVPVVITQSDKDAAQQSHFHDWMATLEHDALTEGIAPDTVHRALDYALLDNRVIALDQKQPESHVTLDHYIERDVSPALVREGRKRMKDNAVLLRKISHRTNVPPEIIVALWGLESSYGRNAGTFSVIDSLMTLAYQGRRADFFRRELLYALLIVDQDHIDPLALRGSWAGAMGQCQFMPSTYLRYAVAYDHKGRRDIWNRKEDVLASIAHYIEALGWNNAETWGREVTLKKPIAAEKIGLENSATLREWNKLGVHIAGGVLKKNGQLKASLLMPDGPGGRSFLVYDNFPVILKWNRSTYFALTVGLLADRIK